MTRCRDVDMSTTAGQPKAGSTSVFDCLSSHPAFRPSRIKEAQFFLDTDYPIPSGLRFDGTNLDRYPDLFNKTHGHILLDASPDYTFCQNFGDVACLLPKAKLVLLQRNPIKRMVSWYRHAAQRTVTLHFDDMRKNPKTAMDRICRLMDVPADIFDSFSFSASSVTSSAASQLICKVLTGKHPSLRCPNIDAATRGSFTQFASQ